MKPRVQQKTNNNNNTRKGRWKPPYDTYGWMRFEVYGFVQKVTSGNSAAGAVDYVDFYLDNPYVKGNINSINVEVPHTLPQLEVGDEITLRGNIRSWWDNDLKTVKYSFVVEEIDDSNEVDDEFEDTPQEPLF